MWKSFQNFYFRRSREVIFSDFLSSTSDNMRSVENPCTNQTASSQAELAQHLEITLDESISMITLMCLERQTLLQNV
jgi:hypothetical protein